MALIDNRPHMASAITTEPTELVAISRIEFERRLKAMDPTVRSLFRLLSHRVRNMAEEMVGWPDHVNWSVSGPKPRDRRDLRHIPVRWMTWSVVAATAAPP